MNMHGIIETGVEMCAWCGSTVPDVDETHVCANCRDKMNTLGLNEPDIKRMLTYRQRLREQRSDSE